MNFETARKNMVDGQLAPNKITDIRLLKAFLDVPREAFVDVSLKNVAYTDETLEIGQGRKMMKPMIAASIIQEMDIQPEDKVLVCASGSGYMAAVIAKLTPSVYAIEPSAGLWEMSRRAMGDAKCKTVKMEKGDYAQGLQGEAPFDKILINAPVATVPEKVLSQLKNGGTIVYMKEGEALDGLCDVVLCTKKGRKLEEKHVMQTAGDTIDAEASTPFTF